MRTSSARQLEFPLEVPEISPAVVGVGRPKAVETATDVAGGTLRLPEFRADRKMYAEMSRQAGRLNAASISDQEHRQYLQEREALLMKFLDGSITQKDQRRLALVNWHLDRIEDASHGYILDILESTVGGYERFASDVTRLIGNLQQHSGQKQRRPK